MNSFLHFHPLLSFALFLFGYWGIRRMLKGRSKTAPTAPDNAATQPKAPVSIVGESLLILFTVIVVYFVLSPFVDNGDLRLQDKHIEIKASGSTFVHSEEWVSVDLADVKAVTLEYRRMRKRGGNTRLIFKLRDGGETQFILFDRLLFGTLSDFKIVTLTRHILENAGSDTSISYEVRALADGNFEPALNVNRHAVR